MDAAAKAAGRATFLYDLTYTDAEGRSRHDQRLFDEMLRLVRTSRSLVVADVFLFNQWEGKGAPVCRRMVDEFTAAWVTRAQAGPPAYMLLITDPINSLYGAAECPHIARLREVGVQVIFTDLDALPDSNPGYSFWYRALFQHLGRASPPWLPNPFGMGKADLGTYLRMLNFKANHRKTIVSDPDGKLTGLVASANVHDASSAHSNVGLVFDGQAAEDLLKSELDAARLSCREFRPPSALPVPSRCEGRDSDLRVAICTEGAIKKAVLEALRCAGPGDPVDLFMFYLSDRHIVKALTRARSRGVRLRIVLDPNKDAFGHARTGIPNRPVAWELHRKGVPIRWFDTHGEQAHAKMLLCQYGRNKARLILGSANYTRRNLENLNLETDVVLRGPAECKPISDAAHFFTTVWENLDGKLCTVPFDAYRDASRIAWLKYRLAEYTGLCTF